ncbi:MAG: MBL fold metallo-hydrolase [Rhodobacteraceae bacterium]|nr:MBL fold metallo-hydrolase [Paracoccaceae bacterium]
MQHDRTFSPCYGEAVELVPDVRRLTCNNPSPFTFHGTNTYIVGSTTCVVIDPGPVNRAHLDAIAAATQGAKVEAILVTHTHLDHSPAARELKKLTGAPIVGCSPHRASRPLAEGESNSFGDSSDLSHQADNELSDGDQLQFGELTLRAIETPGHTANHLSFALENSPYMFSGDHVMGWSTSVVAPPDGSMRAYMNSLDVLLLEKADHYFPGHGGAVQNAKSYVMDLRDHRLQREGSILQALASGASSISGLVETLYVGLDPKLTGAAGLSVLAHLEDLQTRGLVERSVEGPLQLYRLAS